MHDSDRSISQKTPNAVVGFRPSGKAKATLWHKLHLLRRFRRPLKASPPPSRYKSDPILTFARRAETRLSTALALALSVVEYLDSASPAHDASRL